MDIEWKSEIIYQDMVKWRNRLENETPFFKYHLKNYNISKSKILDIACGTGEHLVLFANWGFKGIGMDVSEKNIITARELARRNNVEKKTEFIIGDMMKLDLILKEEEFDVILCIGNTLSIFSSENRYKIINNMLKILKPDGKLIIQVVNYMAHRDETEWFYNPSISRDAEDKVNFYVRIMEWKTKFEKVGMHIIKLRKEEDIEKFSIHNKVTEFFVINIEEFKEISINRNLELELYGDYSNNLYNEEESKDIVVILKKNFNRMDQ